MTSDSGWFAYSPSSDDGNAHLTAEQREFVRRRREAEPEPVGDVRVLIREFAPGQAELRFGGPEDVPTADVIRFAIRELQSALEIFED